MAEADLILTAQDFIFSGAGAVAIVVAVSLVCLGFAWLIHKSRQGNIFQKYPVSVRVWERRGKIFMLTNIREKARAVKDAQGKWFYEFRVAKIFTQPFKFDYINPDNTMDVLRLSRNEYHPFILSSTTGRVIRANGTEEEVEVPLLTPVVDEAFMFAHASRIHKNYARKPEDDFLQKWAPFLTPIIITVCCLLLLTVVLNHMDTIMANYSEVIKTGSQVAGALSQCAASAPALPPVPVGVAP